MIRAGPSGSVAPLDTCFILAPDARGAFLLTPASAAAQVVITVLGVFQIFSAMTIFVLYAMQSGPVRADQLWKQNSGMSLLQAYERAKRDITFTLQFLLGSIFYLFLDLKLLFFCFEFVATVPPAPRAQVTPLVLLG